MTGNSIIITTGHASLIYNPEKVSAAEVPKTLKDMADPKWKGKIGIFNYASSWARWAYYLGQEKVLAELKPIVANGAIVEAMPQLSNRYLLGEIPMQLTSQCLFPNGSR